MGSGLRWQGTVGIGSAWVLFLLAGCAGVRFPWPASSPNTARAPSAAVRTLNPEYDRINSRVLVRKITKPTRANLDFAAYVSNMMLYQPRESQAALSASPDLRQVFGGTLQSIVSGIEQTPLSERERLQPMAFSPMVDFVSRQKADWASGLEDVRAAVRSESWGLPPNIQYTYQEISTAWVHVRQARAPELWVRIEFAPWAKLFSDMPDQNQDGFVEIYAKVRSDLIARSVFKMLAEDYQTRKFNPKEITTWANELASYWYPSFNTDVIAVDGCQTWPNAEVEKEVRLELGELKLKPSLVIRGKPQGVPLYNVFVVDGMSPGCKKQELAKKDSAPGVSGVSNQVSVQTQGLQKGIRAELAQYGSGSWITWAKRLKNKVGSVRQALSNRPKERKALIGKNGFLFFRNSLRYVLSGDLQQQSQEKNPYATIVSFRNYLASLGVDFLIVPVPTKLEVYPDRLLDLPKNVYPILQPYARKLFLELAEASVEVVDLLPGYLKTRRALEQRHQQLYQSQDTHWTDRGVRLAAQVLAARIKQYPWFDKLPAKELQTQLKPVRIVKHGDLHSRLADREQPRYKPQTLRAHQVLKKDQQPLDDDPNSPIVILGDSFTGVFQRIDCRHAGLSAHLAHLLGMPTDLVMSWGGGPNVRKKLLRRGQAALAKKKLVIWVFAARDLYDYWEPWEPIVTEK